MKPEWDNLVAAGASAGDHGAYEGAGGPDRDAHLQAVWWGCQQSGPGRCCQHVHLQRT